MRAVNKLYSVFILIIISTMFTQSVNGQDEDLSFASELSSSLPTRISIRDGQNPLLAGVFNGKYYFDKLKTEDGPVSISCEFTVSQNLMIITNLESGLSETIKIVKSGTITQFKLEGTNIYALPFYLDNDNLLMGTMYARIYGGQWEVFSIKLIRQDDVFVIFTFDDLRI